MGDRVFLNLGRKGRLAYIVALPLDLITLFSQDYTWTIYLSLFWLKRIVM
jgi:hypothetical protein